MRLGTEVDDEGARSGFGGWGGFDDFFLAGTGFDGDLVFAHGLIITEWCDLLKCLCHYIVIDILIYS